LDVMLLKIELWKFLFVKLWLTLQFLSHY